LPIVERRQRGTEKQAARTVLGSTINNRQSTIAVYRRVGARRSIRRAPSPLRAVLRRAEAENAFGYRFAELVRIAAIQTLRLCVGCQVSTSLLARWRTDAMRRDAALNRLPRSFGTFVFAAAGLKTSFVHVTPEQTAALRASRRLEAVLNDTLLDSSASPGGTVVLVAAVRQAFLEHVPAHVSASCDARRRRAERGNTALPGLAGTIGAFFFASAGFGAEREHFFAKHVATRFAAGGVEAVLSNALLDRLASIGDALRLSPAVGQALSENISADVSATNQTRGRRAVRVHAMLRRSASPFRTFVFGTTVIDARLEHPFPNFDAQRRAIRGVDAVFRDAVAYGLPRTHRAIFLGPALLDARVEDHLALLSASQLAGRGGAAPDRQAMLKEHPCPFGTALFGAAVVDARPKRPPRPRVTRLSARARARAIRLTLRKKNLCLVFAFGFGAAVAPAFHEYVLRARFARGLATIE
jgi:hypothetical protein